MKVKKAFDDGYARAVQDFGLDVASETAQGDDVQDKMVKRSLVRPQIRREEMSERMG